MSETELLRAWKADPRRFVREQFGVTPDPWQDEVLAAFPRNQRLAMKACKGPGKTAVLAWLAWNFLAVNAGRQDRRHQRERRQPRRRAVGRDGEVAGEVAAAQRRLQVDQATASSPGAGPRPGG